MPTAGTMDVIVAPAMAAFCRLWFELDRFCRPSSRASFRCLFFMIEIRPRWSLEVGWLWSRSWPSCAVSFEPPKLCDALELGASSSLFSAVCGPDLATDALISLSCWRLCIDVSRVGGFEWCFLFSRLFLMRCILGGKFFGWSENELF